MKIAYRCYFNNKFEIKCEPWTPSVSCLSCYSILLELSREINTRKLSFLEPAVWRQPSSHPKECYFCTVNIMGYNKSNQKSIVYPNVSSVTRPFHEEASTLSRSKSAKLLKPISFDFLLSSDHHSSQPRPLLKPAAFTINPFYFDSSVPEVQSNKPDHYVSYNDYDFSW